MGCLKEHYCIRGLEHYLQFQQPIILQQSLKRLIAAVLSEQHRQQRAGSNDPDALKRQATMRTAEALQEALDRAAVDATDATANDDDSGSDAEESLQDASYCEDDDCSFSSPATTNVSHAEQAPSTRLSVFSVPVSDAGAPSGKLFSVDVMSLHNMNLKLLQEMKAKAAARTTKPRGACGGSGADAFLPVSATLDEIDEELEQWDALYKLQRIRRDTLTGYRRPNSLSYTAATATDRALSITNYYAPPPYDALTNKPTYAMNPSSLLSLQTRGLPREVQKLQDMLRRNATPTTSISTVRRDSVVGSS